MINVLRSRVVWEFFLFVNKEGGEVLFYSRGEVVIKLEFFKGLFLR